MEMLFVVLLFLGPGLIIRAFDNYLYQRRAYDQNLYDYLFNIVWHGLMVFIPSVLILNAVSDFQIETFSEIVESMNSTKTALIYGLIAIVVCIIWWIIFDKCVRKLMLKLKNKCLPRIIGATHLPFENVYTQIFHDPDNDGRLIPVSIYKDGVRVVSGILVSWNSPNCSQMEFKLEYTLEIEDIVQNNPEILDYVRHVYYEPQSNTLIKFHNRKALEEHWAELYSEI